VLTLSTASKVPPNDKVELEVVSLLEVLSWLIVTLPEEPPPLKYVPAVTPVISPALFVNGKSETKPLLTASLAEESAYIIRSPVAIELPSALAALTTTLFVPVYSTFTSGVAVDPSSILIPSPASIPVISPWGAKDTMLVIVAFLIVLSLASENHIVSAPTGVAAVAAKIALSVPA